MHRHSTMPLWFYTAIDVAQAFSIVVGGTVALLGGLPIIARRVVAKRKTRSK